MIVSQHAAQRYVERFAPHLTLEQARAELASHAAAIETAINFGAPIVKLGCGAKLVIQDDTVTTVLPRSRIHAPDVVWTNRLAGTVR